MQMKIYIDVNEKGIRRDPKWLSKFLNGYLSQLAGYKVTDVKLYESNGERLELDMSQPYPLEIPEKE